ncbi:MAG TPA: lipopolysaccharide biosynthesis protein, partial [Gammaproteobacteria bacterium]|nr:lipopolysaccharide biosynthesis protein [Gammaproteobacteria bacterium]
MEQEKSLKEYLDSFRRRKTIFFFTALAIFIIGAITALVLPATYRSSATILIEQQEIPDDLVRSTITTYADQRIQMISQRVMTRTNLSRIIDEYDLYAEDRKRYPLEVIIAKMMEDLDLSMISADVIDPRSGRPMEATIAFSLSYKNESPKLAQVVTNEMTSLFLRENIKTRTSMATQTSEFLAKEAESLSAQIVMLEAQLAEFKNQHLLSLPELTSLNLQLLNRTESEILGVDQELRSLAETK